MNTATITAEINAADVPIFKTLLKKFKAKKIVVTQEKDDTQMCKEDFFKMIDKARAGKKHEISREEMKKMLLG